jgi:hypothetical protein
MKTGKKYIKPLILASAAMLAVMGCSNQSDGTEMSTDTETETTTEAAVVLQKVTYTASDGSVSIILPDSNWTNTLDEDGQLTFVSPGEGKITITYGDTKKKVKQMAFASSESKLKKRLTKLGENTDNLEIQDFSFDKSSGIRNCSYTLKYTDTTDGTYYTVTSVVAADAKGYQITGTLEVGDATLLASVQDSVNSFLILNNSLAETAENDGSGTESGNSGSSSEEQRYFYDEPGNTIYVTQDSDGAWVDENGTVYYFYENHVEDGNGTTYYYDPPAYREGGELYSGSDSGQESSDGSASSGGTESADTYYDFYDSEGNYIKATQDANGNWVGDDGKTYTFGDNGVTDSDGNYYPY